MTASLAAVLLAGPAAHAAEPGLELSRDGRTWSSKLSEPLLSEDVRLVPGGSTRSDMWVHNSSGRTVTMTTLVRDSGTTLSKDVAPRDDFRVRIAGAEVTGTQLSGCHAVDTRVLAPHEKQRILVAVRLPSTSRNVSQTESLALSLRVQLVAGEAADPCSGSAGSSDSDSSEEGIAVPPERPARVATDGGPFERFERSVVPGTLALGLLAVVVTVVGRRRRRHSKWGSSRDSPQVR